MQDLISVFGALILLVCILCIRSILYVGLFDRNTDVVFLIIGGICMPGIYYLKTSVRRHLTKRDRQNKLDELARKIRQNRGHVPVTMCAICLENLDSPPLTESNDEVEDSSTELLFCGHVFHKKCIGDWLERY